MISPCLGSKFSGRKKKLERGGALVSEGFRWMGGTTTNQKVVLDEINKLTSEGDLCPLSPLYFVKRDILDAISDIKSNIILLI